MHQVRPDISREEFEEYTTKKKQASWLEGKQTNILDIRSEGNMSPDRGRLEIAS